MQHNNTHNNANNNNNNDNKSIRDIGPRRRLVLGNSTSPDVVFFSAQFLLGFVVSANLGNTCRSFYDGKVLSLQTSARIAQKGH